MDSSNLLHVAIRDSIKKNLADAINEGNVDKLRIWINEIDKIKKAVQSKDESPTSMFLQGFDFQGLDDIKTFEMELVVGNEDGGYLKKFGTLLYLNAMLDVAIINNKHQLTRVENRIAIHKFLVEEIGFPLNPKCPSGHALFQEMWSKNFDINFVYYMLQSGVDLKDFDRYIIVTNDEQIEIMADESANGFFNDFFKKMTGARSQTISISINKVNGFVSRILSHFKFECSNKKWHYGPTHIAQYDKKMTFLKNVIRFVAEKLDLNEYMLCSKPPMEKKEKYEHIFSLVDFTNDGIDLEMYEFLKTCGVDPKKSSLNLLEAWKKTKGKDGLAKMNADTLELLTKDGFN
jgi:hypothetical protein